MTDTPGPPPAYLRDSRLRHLETEVLEVGEVTAGPWLRLADTVLYPEGGGQPSDRGSIDGLAVGHVERDASGVRHLVDREAVVRSPTGLPSPGARVQVEVDWQRRFDHMQQHTAQHLITALAVDRFGWPTTSFHLGEVRSDVELDARELPPDRLDELEEAVAEEIRAARPLRSRFLERSEVEALGEKVRSRGLPDGVVGPIRLVEIEGIDLNTCGGTHLASTAEIETVKLLGWERMRGGCRLHWVAGGRVRRRLAEHEARCAELRHLFEAADDELVAVATTRQTRLDDTVRHARMLASRLAEALAASFGAEIVVARHLEWADGDALKALTRELSRHEELRLALFTIGAEPPHPFALVSPGAEMAGALGAAVLERLGGNGGGRGPVFQGRSERSVEAASDTEWLSGLLSRA